MATAHTGDDREPRVTTADDPVTGHQGPTLGLLAALTLALLGLAAAPARPAAPGGPAEDLREVVLVANAVGGTVDVIDAHSREVVHHLDVLPDGPNASVVEDDPFHALAGQRFVEAVGGENYAQDLDVSPDGRILYVSRGHRGDVAAFDIASGALLWKVPVSGFRADHMTISGDGRHLYVSALTEDVVEVIDTERAEVVDELATGEWPHDNHLSADGERLYNASIGNIITPWELREARVAVSEQPPTGPYQLTVVDADTLEQLEVHSFDRGVRPFVLTGDGSTMYAQLSEYHGLIEYDLDAAEITRTLDLPIGDGVSDHDYEFEAPHHGLAMSPDESMLCAAGRASDYAALISAETFEPEAIIEVGDAPSWATNDPGGRSCWLANARDDTVSVVSYAAKREVARIDVGRGPKHLEPARVPTDALPQR
jgi:DNA-binding beta-propeller fold protein YncE